MKMKIQQRHQLTIIMEMLHMDDQPTIVNTKDSVLNIQTKLVKETTLLIT